MFLYEVDIANFGLAWVKIFLVVFTDVKKYHFDNMYVDFNSIHKFKHKPFYGCS